MIFNRREALKSLAMLPVIKGATAVQIGDPKVRHYILFYDAQTLDAQDLTDRAYEGILPENSIIALVRVHLRHEQSIEDAIKLYEVADGF